MKKIALLALVAGALAFADALIVNGDFEQGLEHWVVPSWIKNAATPELDSAEKPNGGKASLKLLGADGKLPIVFQGIKFLPGVRKYQVSYQIKTENMNDWGYVILYVSNDKNAKRYYSQTVGAGKGKDNSRPWQRYTAVMEVPEDADGARGKVFISFGGKTSGTAWIDDFVIEPEGAAAPNKAEEPAQKKAEEKKAESILPNGLFEAGLDSWIVPSWIKNAATPELDSAEIPVAGRASLKLVAADGKLPIVYQQFKFLPGITKYQVSFQIKTENINNWGYVLLHVADSKTGKRYYSQTVGAANGVNNSRPWTLYTGKMEIPPETAGGPGKVTIQCGGKTTGTAWIDDIMIIPEGDAAPATQAPAKDDKAAKEQDAEAKKKLNEKLKQAVDTDCFMQSPHWTVSTWIPNSYQHKPADVDFDMTLPAGKLLAVRQAHMSINENCSGPFRLTAWLKIPAEAAPLVSVSSAPMDTKIKADYRTFRIGATGNVKDGFAEYAGNFLVPENTAELNVSVRSTKALDAPSLVAVRDVKLRPVVIPGEDIALYQINSLGEEGLFIPGETPGAELLFRNSYSSEKTLALQCSAVDYFGNKVRDFSHVIKLPALSITRHKIMLPGLEKNGFYAVNCTWNDAGKSRNADFSFVCLEPPPENPDTAFGITFIGGAKGAAMRRLGVGSKGVLMAWRWTECSDGTYDWSAIDRTVADCVANNIRIIGGFEDSTLAVPARFKPRNANKDATLEQVFDEAYFDAAAKFEKAAVERYGKIIKEWTFNSEINLLMYNNKYEADHYVKRIRKSAPELRKALPDIIITAIGVSGGDGRAIPRYQTTRLLWEKLHDVLDGISPDQYTDPGYYGPGNNPVDSESGMLREMMSEAWRIVQEKGKNRLGIAEKGFHVIYALPMDSPYSRDLGNVLAREYVITKSLPIAYWLYYGWRQWRDGARYDYGMWKGPSPRHAAAAYAGTARLLCNADFVLKDDLHKDVPLFLFTRGGESIAVLWKSGQGKDISMLVELPGDARVCDVQGNQIPAASGKCSLELTSAPIYIFTREKPDVLSRRLHKGILSLPELQMVAVLQDRDTIRATLLNLTNSPLKAECSVGGGKETVELKPLALGEVSFKCPSQRQDSLILQAKTAKGFVYKAECDLAAIPVRRTTSWKELEKLQPAFVLDRADEHLSNIDFAANGLWTGKDDCSAKVWMGYDSSRIFILAKVTDEFHSNEFTDRIMAWAGDCVQFAFDSRHDALTKRLQGRNVLFDDDYLFTAAMIQGKPCIFNELNMKADAKAAECQISRNEAEKETVYRISIPFAMLPALSVKPGNVFGFSLNVMDCDSPRETAKYCMQLTPGIAGGQNPSAFKAFVFE